MPALITTLITTRDNSEVVRDRIAEILLLEVAQQQVLAAAADPAQDPDLWKLRVFTEREDPWEEFLTPDAPENEDPPFVEPIVNIWFDNTTYDGGKSDPINRQKATGIYNIDCYGYGVSSDLDGGDHDPGDARSRIEAQRAARLVRKILMAGAYPWLGLARGASQFIWGRRVLSIQAFPLQLAERSAIHVSALRIAFQVEFNEFSPQVQGVPLEELVVSIKRAETGEVSLTFQVGESPP